jgi:hypothetical protein
MATYIVDALEAAAQVHASNPYSVCAFAEPGGVKFAITLPAAVAAVAASAHTHAAGAAGRLIQACARLFEACR